MRLKDKVALVTGGGSGMGKAVCLEFAREGAQVVVADMNFEAAEAVVNLLKEEKLTGIPVQVNQTISADVKSMVNASISHFGKIDILFANAGIGVTKPILKLAEEDWRKNIDVNLNGTFLVCQAVAQQMVQQKVHGSIIVNSSQGSLVPTSWFTAYCVSKAGLNMLVKCMSIELGNHRIRVNAVLPGLIETPMSSAVIQRPKIQASIKAAIPAGRWGQVDDVSKTVLFLASDDSKYINGQLITVDGGWVNTTAFQYFYLDYTTDGEEDWRTEVVYKHNS